MTEQSIIKKAHELYESIGPSAVYDFSNRLHITYLYCKGCEADTPSAGGECLLCGSKQEVTQ